MAAQPTVVLIHSPALGPESWEGVAASVSSSHPVVVPSLRAAGETGPPYWSEQCRLVRRGLDHVAESSGIVLVGHSGSGPLLALIGAEIRHRIFAYVFVDAGLPREGAWLDTAPSLLLERLRSLEVDGVLPPWSEWWDPEELAAEVSDPAMRERFRASLPSLPMAMFEEARPGVPEWPDAPCGYLQLSEGYASEARQAEEWGWPIDVAPTGHLGPVTDPVEVANRVLALVTRLERVA